jgi:hypothetical protein
VEGGCAQYLGALRSRPLLDGDRADEHFIENGPEAQGWVVGPNGEQADSDLTRPLAWLLG